MQGAALTWTLPYKACEADTWIQLAMGREIVCEGGVPARGPFSWSAAEQSQPFVEPEWFTYVLFWVIYATFGLTGLAITRGAIATLPYRLVVQTARVLGARLTIILPAMVPLLYLSAWRFTERPHLFSSLLLALYL
jgi:hypothetical protein